MGLQLSFVTAAPLSERLQAEKIWAEDAVAFVGRPWQQHAAAGPQPGSAPALVGIGHPLMQTCYSSKYASSDGQLQGMSQILQRCPKTEVGVQLAAEL